MSYANFKPIVWSQFIQRELEKKCRLVEDCWKQFEGEARHGKQVKILGVGSPTVGDYTGESIGKPEVIDDNAINLDIDQAKYFNFMVDDVDRAQSVPGLMETLIKEATSKMAQTRDSYVASLAAQSENISQSTQVSTPEAAKAALDAALLALRENDVDLEDEVVIEIAPFFYQLLRDNLAAVKTVHDDLIARGVVGMYDNCRVKLSNNLYSDDTDTYMMVRTKRAIAFVGAIDQVEAYRPETLFSDAMKGLNVYGAKIVRPKELYVIKAHK